MKKRIISGLIIAAIIIAIAVLGWFFSITYSVVTALLGAVCVYELLFNTGFCKNMPIVLIGSAFAAISPFIKEDLIFIDYSDVIAVFVVAVIIVSLISFKKTFPTTMGLAIALPLLVSLSFRSIVLMSVKPFNGLLNLVLLLCYTVVPDIGAYFAGIFFGKTKMSPNISPKKTFEGLLGGMVSGIIIVLAACLLFKLVFKFYYLKTVLIVLTTPIFVFLGVLGDLSASYIKRGAGIKDFGDTIPGHGGIMDRLDSILLVAPVLYIFDNIVTLAGM